MPPQLHHGKRRPRRSARDQYKQVEFLSTRIGETFKGLVNGAIGRGLFVELDENKCEGFVPKESFPWDQWALTRTERCSKALLWHQNCLGDPITIRVVLQTLPSVSSNSSGSKTTERRSDLKRRLRCPCAVPSQDAPSSVGQSRRLIISWSQVRALQGAHEEPKCLQTQLCSSRSFQRKRS